MLKRLIVAAALMLPAVAMAQTVPTQNPTYIPQAVSSAQSLTAAGNIVWTLNSIGLVAIDVQGTNSALSGYVQGAVEVAGSSVVTWQTLSVFPESLAASPALAGSTTITANGIYKVRTNGYKQLRFVLSSLTGTNVTVSMSGGAGSTDPHSPINSDLGAVITNTAAGAGTVTSSTFNNLDGVGIRCVYNQSAVTGTPSNTFAIQEQDAASGMWMTIATSGTITTSTNTAYVVEVAPGVATSSLPSNWVAQNLHVGPTWRVTETIGGTTPSVTGTIGCQLLR